MESSRCLGAKIPPSPATSGGSNVDSSVNNSSSSPPMHGSTSVQSSSTQTTSSPPKSSPSDRQQSSPTMDDRNPSERTDEAMDVQ